MAERWNSPAKFIETIITLVLMYSGEEADSAKITDIISVLLDINVSILSLSVLSILFMVIVGE